MDMLGRVENTAQKSLVIQGPSVIPWTRAFGPLTMLVTLMALARKPSTPSTVSEIQVSHGMDLLPLSDISWCHLVFHVTAPSGCHPLSGGPAGPPPRLLERSPSPAPTSLEHTLLLTPPRSETSSLVTNGKFHPDLMQQLPVKAQVGTAQPQHWDSTQSPQYPPGKNDPAPQGSVIFLHAGAAAEEGHSPVRKNWKPGARWS